MRILAVNWQDLENAQAGGAEVHLFEILERLAARGHSITLLCGGWRGCAPRTTYRGVEIHRTGTRYTFPMHARRFYRRVLAPVGFDVLLEDINKLPLLTPRWGRTPVVALVPHLFGTTAFKELPAPMAALVWAAERAIPIAYRRVPFHAISRSTADDLAARGIRRDAITVIYPGVDSAIFSPAPSERSALPLFSYVGRLKRYKGVDIILRAFARAEIPGARLEIAGAGDYRGELERLASSLDLGGRVSFLGFVSESDKVRLMRRSWSLIFTSPKEGWGITNLEAQACGTPVIASDSPGLRESVRGGVSGLLVRHGEMDGLIRAMRELATSAELVSSMGRAGRKFAEEFTWERTAEQTEQHLSGALDRIWRGETKLGRR